MAERKGNDVKARIEAAEQSLRDGTTVTVDQIGPRRGRPRQHDDRTNTSIRLAPALLKAVQDAAAERNISANVLITKAIEDFLARLIPVSELKLTREP